MLKFFLPIFLGAFQASAAQVMCQFQIRNQQGQSVQSRELSTEALGGQTLTEVEDFEINGRMGTLYFRIQTQVVPKPGAVSTISAAVYFIEQAPNTVPSVDFCQEDFNETGCLATDIKARLRGDLVKSPSPGFQEALVGVGEGAAILCQLKN